MLRFVVKRLFIAIFVVIAVTLLVSFAVRLTGDPAIMLAQGAGSVTQEDLVRIRKSMGLDKPFIVQYLEFLKGMATFDFGRSFMGGTPVGLLIGKALPATILLALSSMVLSIVLSIPLGIASAVSKGKWPDQLIRTVSLLGLSFPNYWLAMMLVLLLSIVLGWLPPSGLDGPLSFIMPTLTMGLILTASNVRLVRTNMLETLGSQYIMVARAKGLGERAVLYKHALRNCSVPLITYFGLQFGGLLGGIVVVERVFNWPGMGTLAFDAVATRDYPVLEATICVLATLIVLVNLVVDIAYGLIDPRIRNE